MQSRKRKQKDKKTLNLLEHRTDIDHAEFVERGTGPRFRQPRQAMPDEIVFPSCGILGGDRISLHVRNTLAFGFHGRYLILPTKAAPFLILMAMRVRGENVLPSERGLPGTMFTKECVDFNLPSLSGGHVMEIEFEVLENAPEGMGLFGVKVQGCYLRN